MPRLVTIGDSLTQGFQHAAIRRTDWSYPAMVARALNADFARPSFDAGGLGGPLVDLERVAHLFDAVGKDLSFLSDARALATGIADLRSYMGELEAYWERGGGTKPSGTLAMHHNLAVWGFEVLDALTLSDGVCQRNTPEPRDDFILQVPEMAMYRTARRVLNPLQQHGLAEMSQLDLAAEIGRSEAIEDLVFALGANNALATCLSLELRWSQSADLRKLPHQRTVTIWEPDHFRTIYDLAVKRLERVNAKRVYLATVPHVTIAPVTRGVTPNAEERRIPELYFPPGSSRGYFEYYTRFWLWDPRFEPHRHPHLKREDAMAVDRAIDEYNAHIQEVAHRHGWNVIDLCSALDDLAFRSRQGRPDYRFPDGLIAALRANENTSFRVRGEHVLLDTRFMAIPKASLATGASIEEWQRAYRGGLFGLDGVHPTTVGYGIIAHAVLAAMQKANSPGADPAALDWVAIVANDSLLVDTPPILASLEDTLKLLFDRLGLSRVIERLGGVGAQP